MSRRNIDKQVYEQYVDATVALFMEHYTAVLTDTILEKKSASVSCSETLDRRCMEAIRKESAKQRHREIWQGTKKVLRSAAVILIAMLSLSSVLFITVEAFRVPVINFFIEQGDGFWVITGKTEDQPIDSNFDPNDPLAGLLPEEYKLERVSSGFDNRLLAVYANQNGSKFRFSITPSSDITVDSENASISKKYKIAGYAGIYVYEDGLSQLAWVDEENHKAYLMGGTAISESELLSIAEQLMEIIEK